MTNVDLEVENQRLRDALRRFGKHTIGCPVRKTQDLGCQPSGDCNCEFGAALAGTEEA